MTPNHKRASALPPVYPVFCTTRTFSLFRTRFTNSLSLHLLAPPTPSADALASPRRAATLKQELPSLCAPLPAPVASRSLPSLLPAPHATCAPLAFLVSILFTLPLLYGKICPERKMRTRIPPFAILRHPGVMASFSEHAKYVCSSAPSRSLTPT